MSIFVPEVVLGESGDYNGEHSIIITDPYGNVRHTNDDWHLVPEKLLVVDPPEFKSNEIKNPGGDGILDLSEAITGFPMYGQRTGSWEFSVLNDWTPYQLLYSDILNFVHGKNVKVILTDEPDWYYNGRIIIEGYSPDSYHSKIKMKYSFDPYKLYITDTTGDWQWPSLNLVNGVIYQRMFKNIQYTIRKTLHFSGTDIGRRVVNPTFTLVSGTCTKLSVKNEELWGSNPVIHENLSIGDNYFTNVVFSGYNPNNNIIVDIYGTGTINIKFRPGKL